MGFDWSDWTFIFMVLSIKTKNLKKTIYVWFQRKNWNSFANDSKSCRDRSVISHPYIRVYIRYYYIFIFLKYVLRYWKYQNIAFPHPYSNANTTRFGHPNARRSAQVFSPICMRIASYFCDAAPWSATRKQQIPRHPRDRPLRYWVRFKTRGFQSKRRRMKKTTLEKRKQNFLYRTRQLPPQKFGRIESGFSILPRRLQTGVGTPPKKPILRIRNPLKILQSEANRNPYLNIFLVTDGTNLRIMEPIYESRDCRGGVDGLKNRRFSDGLDHSSNIYQVKTYKSPRYNNFERSKIIFFF